MDADKQGFLRSYRSLIQIIGRCARNAEGKVLMYADTVSEAMDQSIKETNRRREIQDQYNKEHGIVPKTVIKKIKDVVTNEEMEKLEDKKLTKQDKEQILEVMEEEMKQAAANLDFEKAAEFRDLIFEMKAEL
jgi:excinuclease ABC subunit B